MKTAEIVPNFSEGRDERTIAELVRTAQGVSGAALLDATSDVDHNRSVLTIAGTPDALEEAAFRLIKRASESIDMTRHKGAHPRMGAADVVPFVPLRGTTADECILASRRVAERVWEELRIPVYLYGDSASREERADLAKVRRGEFEGLSKKISTPGWEPDFGDAPHPTAGAVAVGARRPLVAFNVELDTSDVEIARSIARAIRGSNGGYKACKALGIMLTSKGRAQVSINLVDTETTPIYRVYEAIRFEAARWGVSITGSELIGLAQSRALVECAEYYLRLHGFDSSRQVLEERLLDMKEM